MAATVVTSENSAEFYASKMGLPSATAPTEAAEQAEPVVENTSEDDDQVEADEPASQQEEQKPVNPKVEKRFSELTKQREDAKREAAKEREAREAVEAKVKELEAKLNPQPEPKLDEKPKPGQFTDAFEYAEALAEWSAENALKNRDKQEAEKKQIAEHAKVVNAWNERQTAAKAVLTDYDDTIASSKVAVSDQVRDAILESEVGPQILYHLAKNPEIAEWLTSKSATSALREIGRLEASLSGDKKPTTEKPAASISKAASPINPIKATKAVDSPIDSKGEFHGTFAQWKEARKAGKV